MRGKNTQTLKKKKKDKKTKNNNFCGCRRICSHGVPVGSARLGDSTGHDIGLGGRPVAQKTHH